MEDPFDLQRFVTAQGGGTYDSAIHELRSGRKETHWMWFVFPQIAGLGRSSTAQRYAISGLPEARAYVAHRVLGARLAESARSLVEIPGDDAVAVFGPIDAQKLQSSMTLFSRADPNEPLYQQVLDRYFDGRGDDGTLSRL